MECSFSRFSGNEQRFKQARSPLSVQMGHVNYFIFVLRSERGYELHMFYSVSLLTFLKQSNNLYVDDVFLGNCY